MGPEGLMYQVYTPLLRLWFSNPDLGLGRVYITSVIRNNLQRMQESDKLIFLGVVTGAHGIKGDVLVRSFTSPATNITKIVLQDELGDKVILKLLRSKSHSLVCSIDGVMDRNKAEAICGRKLYALRSSLPNPDKSEYYIEDMKGLDVRNQGGQKIGAIVAIHNFGAGDVVEINFDDGSNEMYPFTNEIFPEVSDEWVVFVEQGIPSPRLN